MVRVWLLAVAAGAVLLAAWQGATYKSYPDGLPSTVKSDLRSRDCDVLRERGVVIEPEFTAVLCRIGDEGSLLIYARGAGKPSVLNRHPGGLDEKNPEAARGIRAVHWGYVAQHNRELKLPEHPETCIEDGLGMGSTLYCYLDGEWVGLAGAD